MVIESPAVQLWPNQIWVPTGFTGGAAPSKNHCGTWSKYGFGNESDAYKRTEFSNHFVVVDVVVFAFYTSQFMIFHYICKAYMDQKENT